MASAMLQSLSDRLSSLSIIPSSLVPSSSEGDASPATTSIRSYAFKPKGGAATGDSANKKLVLVVAEEDRDIGKATALAKLLGFKDMRAAEEDYLKDVLDEGKANLSPFALTDSNAADVLLVLSDSIYTLSTPVSVGSTTLDSANDLKKFIHSTRVSVKELKFNEKGAAATATTPAAPAAKASKEVAAAASAANPLSKASAPSSKPGKDSKDTLQDDPRNIQSLGMTIKKEQEDFGGWYKQVLTYGDLIDYYDVSGCYILKPASYGIWEVIQRWFDTEIKKLGVENCYFPMFVSNRVLQKEKDHIEGFAAEVAWVTKAGSSDLQEPIAIRPTSETVMYPYYAKWIRSYRDLPLRLNQWCNVVRWEFKNPQPFLRTREFLWQEGHTAFMTKEEADKEVLQILDLYRRVYEDLLAVHVIPGVKSEKERFAGGLYTTTVEGFIPTTGRGIQGGTSHCLGQNFSKMFDITVEDPARPASIHGEASKLHVWQNSWGLTTRTIGVMIMVHGDDKGLVMPPRIAQCQVTVVPCGMTVKNKDLHQAVLDKAQEIANTLIDAGMKAKADLREGYTPGFKFNDGELRGIPLRLEIGPKDLEQNQVLSIRRDNSARNPIPMASLAKDVSALLETIQADMFAKAKAGYEDRLKVVTEWSEFVPTLNKNCICVIPWCEVTKCEEDIKDKSAEESKALLGEEDEKAPSAGAKSLCIPFDQDRWGYKIEQGTTKCTGCGEPAKRWTLFGRSY